MGSGALRGVATLWHSSLYSVYVSSVHSLLVSYLDDACMVVTFGESEWGWCLGTTYIESRKRT